MNYLSSKLLSPQHTSPTKPYHHLTPHTHPTHPHHTPHHTHPITHIPTTHTPSHTSPPHTIPSYATFKTYVCGCECRLYASHLPPTRWFVWANEIRRRNLCGVGLLECTPYSDVGCYVPHTQELRYVSPPTAKALVFETIVGSIIWW